MLKEGSARIAWRKLYRQFLDSLFEERSSNRIALRPDDAVDFMEKLLADKVSGQEGSGPDKNELRQPFTFRFDFDAFRREAHHYAVDLYYRTYFPRKRGAPPLPLAYLDRILHLRRKGWKDERIAKELGQTKDNIRKQIAAAEKRLRGAVEGIERIKRAFPDIVASDTSRRQSKRQRDKRRPGK